MNIGQSICGAWALETLRRLAIDCNQLPEGDVAEVGVYKGGSARMLADFMPECTIYLFDTFDGMPQTNEFDNMHRKGDFADTSFELVCQLFLDSPNVEVYKGCFPEQNSEIVVDKKFRLVHLDVDIYDSHVACLEFFQPRMVKGGVIVCDDYNAPTCHGAKKAIDEFAKKYNHTIIPGGDFQAYIVFSQPDKMV